MKPLYDNPLQLSDEKWEQIVTKVMKHSLRYKSRAEFAEVTGLHTLTIKKIMEGVRPNITFQLKIAAWLNKNRLNMPPKKVRRK